MQKKRIKKKSKSKHITRKILLSFLSVFVIFVLVIGIYIYTLLDRSGYVDIPITSDYSVSEGILDDESDPNEEVTPEPVNSAEISSGTSYEAVPYKPVEWGTGRVSVYYDSRFPIRKVDQKDPDIENYLLFGVDARSVSETRSRSDSIIVVSVDTKHDSIKLTSIMRDTKVKIEGRTVPNKINAAYAFGGIGLMINTINSTFGLDIQKFAMVDMHSAADVIDAVGGVYIDVKQNELRFVYGSASAAPGMQLLNGTRAVRYGRIRYIGSDTARTQRQRTVLTQLIVQFKAAPLSQKMKFFEELVGSFETNITKTNMTTLAFDVLYAMDDIRQYRVPETGMYTTNPVNYQLNMDLDRQIPALHDFIWGDGTGSSTSLPDENPEPTSTPTPTPTITPTPTPDPSSAETSMESSLVSSSQMSETSSASSSEVVVTPALTISPDPTVTPSPTPSPTPAVTVTPEAG